MRVCWCAHEFLIIRFFAFGDSSAYFPASRDRPNMGLVYDVIFKPIGRSDVSDGGRADDHAAAAVQPEWVLDNRDGGTLVWRRHDLDVRPAHRKRRVEFLDAVQVRVFERDDYGGQPAAGGRYDDDYDDDQLCWDDDDGRRDRGCYSKTLFYRDDRYADGPALTAVSVVVLGLCIGLAYQFAPVRWLVHQLLVG